MAATIIQPRDIVRPIETTKQVVQTATGNSAPGNNEDFMDKLVKLFDAGAKLIEQGSHLTGTFERIAQKKGVVSRTDGQGNPVLDGKIKERELGRPDNDYVRPREDAKALPGTPVDVPPQNYAVQEEKQMQINDKFLEQCVDTTFEMLEEKVPDEWKDKTVRELIEMYKEKALVRMVVKQTLVKELHEIVEQAVQ